MAIIFAVLPVLALSDLRYVRLMTQSVIVLLLAWLIAEPMVEFIKFGKTGGWLLLQKEVRVQMVLAVATVVGLIPYDLRGWRGKQCFTALAYGGQQIKWHGDLRIGCSMASLITRPWVGRSAGCGCLIAKSRCD
jgi:hypothetical protein